MSDAVAIDDQMTAPAPMLVSWNITRRCNLACRHCYLDAVQRGAACADELATGEACGVIVQIAGLAPGAMLVLSGGEPLLRRDLATLVRHAAAQGLVPVIGTSGTLLSEQRVMALKEAGAAGIAVSIDSATPAFHDGLRGVPGAWRAALRGARAARASGVPLLVQTTLFEQNRRDLAALGDIAEALEAVALNVFFLVCTGRGATRTDLTPAAYEEALERVIELQRERPQLVVRARCAPYLRRLLRLRAGESAQGYAAWSGACLAGRSYFRITPEGDVTPCPYIPVNIGNVRKSALRDIWHAHPTLERLRAELPGGKCGGCDFRLSCGGCRARAFAVHGDLMAEDPQCAYVRVADRAPETRAAREASSMTWDPAASALLERIPNFARAAVRARLEQIAAREGVSSITVELMRAHRPRFADRAPPFVTPQLPS